MNTKQERREKKRKNSRKMIMSGRSLFVILRIKRENAKAAIRSPKVND